VLLDDPTDPQEFGAAVLGLLGDPESARRMGDEAQARVRADFLPSRHLGQWVQLIASVLDGRRA
jgi:glycosyltransferase involved in cell wall biosynthesis